MRGADLKSTRRARSLRRRSTRAEWALWLALADRPVFRRFCLPRAAAHYRGRWRTACRQRIRSAAGRIPQSLGYLIVRVWNNEVLGNLDGVLQMLASELKIAPHPVPLPAGGERERSGNAE